MPAPSADDVLGRLEELAEPKILEVNRRYGDEQPVDLTTLRGLAKALKHQPLLARELWQRGDTAGRQVSILISRAKDFEADELDGMLRDACIPKMHDWLAACIIAKSTDTEDLRAGWPTRIPRSRAPAGR